MDWDTVRDFNIVLGLVGAVIACLRLAYGGRWEER